MGRTVLISRLNFSSAPSRRGAVTHPTLPLTDSHQLRQFDEAIHRIRIVPPRHVQDARRDLRLLSRHWCKERNCYERYRRKPEHVAEHRQVAPRKDLRLPVSSSTVQKIDRGVLEVRARNAEQVVWNQESFIDQYPSQSLTTDEQPVDISFPQFPIAATVASPRAPGPMQRGASHRMNDPVLESDTNKFHSMLPLHRFCE